MNLMEVYPAQDNIHPLSVNLKLGRSMKKIMLSVASVLIASPLFASILPENYLNIPVDSKQLQGLTQIQYNNVVNKFESTYSPIVRNLGGNLVINRLWTDGTVNSNAVREGQNWIINSYGGLARHPSITTDGLALVLCHEVGHHLGGAPKIAHARPENKWATNEGQADYFATLKCLRHVFLNDNNEAIIKKMTVPSELSAACKKSFSNAADANICIRSGMAGVSVSNLFANLSHRYPALFSSPDQSVVDITYDNHPDFQCRLDTFFQGSICTANPNEDVSQTDEVQGTCHKTLGYSTGLRPACWFKATVL